MSDRERDVLLKKIAALEAELEDLKPSGQVAEDEATVRAVLAGAAHENTHAALSRLAAKAQERDEALKQATLAWERHAEKDRAYSEALAQRDAAREERDAALADNAALAEALEIATRGRAVRDQGNAPGHAHAIPGIWDNDNGGRSGTACEWCRIEWPKVQRAQHTTHPGAALLEEHRKALVRARNDGLERAADRVGPAWGPAAAAAIRAMKEPES